MMRQGLVLSIVFAMVAVGISLRSQVAIAQGPAPRSPRASMGTAFTYQGQLKSGGSAYSGNCDFQFSLYDSASSGTQIGSTQTATSVAVASGLFTTQIDFGASAFNGDARWLDIGVRCPAGSGSNTALASRQQLTAAPYALYATSANTANSATTAASATNAANAVTAINFSGSLAGDVTGTQSSTSVGKLQGRTVASTAPTTGQVLEYDGSQWVPGNYQKVVVVAQSGGNFTSIQAAINSMTVQNGSDRYLVRVMPGVYNERVTMKGGVDVEGSGEFGTRIASSGGSAYDTGATVIAASGAELRFLTVTSAAGNAAAYAVAIYNGNSQNRFLHVTASASGGTTASYGMYNASFFSSPTLTYVTLTGSGEGTNSSYGLYNNSGTPTLNNVTARATGGTNSYGIYNDTGSDSILTNVTASASAATNNYGIYNNTAMLTISSSMIFGTNYGIYNNRSDINSYKVYIDASQIYGATSIRNTAGFTTYVGASKLAGAADKTAGGTFACASVYDTNYAAYPCP